MSNLTFSDAISPYGGCYFKANADQQIYCVYVNDNGDKIVILDQNLHHIVDYDVSTLLIKYKDIVAVR